MSHTHNAGGGHTRAALAPARLARSLRLTDVAWAAPAPAPPQASAGGCSNPVEQTLRLSLLEPLVAFLVGELVLPLLRAAFFVTEADGTGACVGMKGGVRVAPSIHIHLILIPRPHIPYHIPYPPPGLQLHFFRKPVWRRALRLARTRVLLAGQYEQVAPAALGLAATGRVGGAAASVPFSLLPTRLGLSAVRLMPKKKVGFW